MKIGVVKVRLGVALAVLCMSACSSQLPQSGIPASAWEGATVDPLKPVGMPKGFPAPGPVQLAEAYDSGNTIGTWRLIELRNDSQEIVIQYSQGGGCTVSKGVYVAETDEKVALVPVYDVPNTSCTSNSSLRAPFGIVTLSRPLGQRQLLHVPGEDKAY